MGEHKYQEAYKKGYEAGKRDAFTGYCQQCYDELPLQEQIKLMIEWGADVSKIKPQGNFGESEDKKCITEN